MSQAQGASDVIERGHFRNDAACKMHSGDALGGHIGSANGERLEFGAE